MTAKDRPSVGVLIVDYGLCNLDSVKRAVEQCGAQATISDDPTAAAEATKIILPGVGSFSDAAGRIRSAGWDVALRREALENRIPLLGICLGMHLLADSGTEGAGGGSTQGLGLIHGKVVALEPPDRRTRIPHIGWNEVVHGNESPLFRSIPSGKDFYFVHSYQFVPASESVVLARTPYCGEFVSVVGTGSIFGTQFHPEKSQRVGLQLLKNFIELEAHA